MAGIQLGWYVAGDVATASIRLRCLIPMESLATRGHGTSLWHKNKNASFDVMIFSKIYDDRALATAQNLRKRGTRIVLDLCDNHWFGEDEHLAIAARAARLEKMLKVIDRVTVSTPLLAKQIAMRFGLEEELISVVPDPVLPMQPTSVALRGRWEIALLKRYLKRYDQSCHLVWFGNHGAGHVQSGMEDLKRIRDVIDVPDHKFSLTIISNSTAKYKRIFKGWQMPKHYVPWRIDTVDRMLMMHDCAVIPITPNPFTLAKTMNRPATALMAGLQVFADGIPSYRELSAFITLDDWAALHTRASQSEGFETRINASRDYLNEHYSPSRIADYWLEAIGLTLA